MEKRILNEETKKALRGFLPFSCDSYLDFTPEQIVNKTPPILVEFQPKFSIRSMTKAEKNEYNSIRENIKTDEKGNTPTSEYKSAGEKSIKIYRACLKGWRDFFDTGTGEEIPFVADASANETFGCSEESWNKIPDWIQIEISKEIRKISNLLPIEMLSLK